MATDKCPICGSPCIIKMVAMEDERYCEVDVCKLCLTMYPREAIISAAPKAAIKKSKPKKRPAKASRKKKASKKTSKRRAKKRGR
ncbi:MAG: hypothetical protein A3K67_06415 [Euryarchaeota archaeon RBG_16_62_10]|nr:MAG: hypothetical protein A3K67_06415 [Euryarchaeota archaeon RBG_16_62_10]